MLNVVFQTAIDPGDEVILFDPSYETYEGCVTMAGGVPVSSLSWTFFKYVSYFFLRIIHNYRSQWSCMFLVSASVIDITFCNFMLYVMSLCPFDFVNWIGQIHVPLVPPQWTLDRSKLLISFTERTKAIVLNRLEITQIHNFLHFRWTSSSYWEA